MTDRQLSSIIAPWMNAAIEKHGQGEKILWECALVPFPAEVPGQPDQPGAVVLMWFPGPIVGDTLNGSFRITNPMTLAEEEIDTLIGSFLEHMRTTRSKMLAEQSEHAMAGT